MAAYEIIHKTYIDPTLCYIERKIEKRLKKKISNGGRNKGQITAQRAENAINTFFITWGKNTFL